MKKNLERNKFYKLDCFEFLDGVPDNSVDLAVIDPPYNLKKADWDTFRDHGQFLEFTQKWIDALIPKLKQNGSFYVFNTPYNSAFILAYLVKKEMLFQNWITWDKRDGLSGARRKYSNGQETILFFTKGPDHVFNYNDIRLPYESSERIQHAAVKGILKNGERWFPNPLGKLCGEVWHITSERHKNKVHGKIKKMAHVTPKPLDLIERIVKASSNPGDVVLDCFAGSGTTAVAAKKLGRDFLCCDANGYYVDIAKERISSTKKYA